MINKIVLVLLVFSSFKSMCQIKHINGKLELLECEGKNKSEYKRCFYETVGNYLSAHFTEQQVSKLNSLHKEGKRDTLKLGFGFLVGKEGRIIEESFEGSFKNKEDLKRFVFEKLKDRLLFKLPLNNCSRPMPFYGAGVSLFFVSDQKDLKSIRLLPFSVVDFNRKKKKNNYSGKVLDIAPVYKGCKRFMKKGNKALKSCLSQNVSKYISDNFNTKVAKGLGFEGCATRISTSFKITKEGRVDDIKVYAEHEVLEKETIRILKKFPKVKPGIKKGKPVNVDYSLPIILKI